MKKCACFLAVIVILAFLAGPLAAAQADVVGRLTQVEGRVDLLKAGQLPATPVKVEDKVQTGDVLRTKSLSKAQITFIDNSTLTIAPESRVGIEAYMFDAAQQKRNAVLEIFQGLAHVVVNKILKATEPDFVVKTQTATMGVRGTDFGIRIQPNSSEILNFEGLLQVGNVFPEVGQLSRRAFKLAYSFGPEGGAGHHWVFLKKMQGTTVGRNLPPTQPYDLSSQDRELFMKPFSALNPGGANLSQGYESLRVAFTGPQGSTTPLFTNLMVDQNTLTILNTITVPPVAGSGVQPSSGGSSSGTGSSTNFTQVFTGPYQLSSTQPFTMATINNTGPGLGVRTGVYPGAFNASYNLSLVWVDSGQTFNPSYEGTFRATMSGLAKSGLVAGATQVREQPLTGTMKAVLTDTLGGRLKLSGPVTLTPSGGLYADLTGTGVAYITPTTKQNVKITSGTFYQTPATGTIGNQPVTSTGSLAHHAAKTPAVQ
jgi:hypothetical protein